MSESAGPSLGAVESYPADNRQPHILGDNTSQVEAPEKPMSSSNEAGNSGDVTTGIITEPGPQVESLALDLDMPQNTGLQPLVPDPADPRSLVAKKLRVAALGTMAGEETFRDAQGDEKQNEDKKTNAASEQSVSGPTSLSTPSKRIAEDRLECTEKKRKIEESDGRLKDGTVEPVEEGREPDPGRLGPIVISETAEPEGNTIAETNGQHTDNQSLQQEAATSRNVASPDSVLRNRARDAPQKDPVQTRPGTAAAGSKEKGTKSRKKEDFEDEEYQDNSPPPESKYGEIGDSVIEVSPDFATPGPTKQKPKITLAATKPRAKETAPTKPKAREAAPNEKKDRLQKSSPQKTIHGPFEAARAAGDVHRGREGPKDSPSRQQANPADMTVLCDRSYVEKQMGRIESSVNRSMLAFFQEQHIDAQARPSVISSPEPELEDLYKIQWSDDWQATFSDLRSRKKQPAFLRQKTTFMGLLGAGIKSAVFDVPLPWDIGGRLGDDLRYIEQAVNELGHELDDVMKKVKGRQIADPKFQKEKVAPQAKLFAGKLALTLTAHVQQMKRRGKFAKADIVEHDHWLSYLEEAFHTAIILKQTLVSSNLGPFAQDWPCFEEGSFEIKWHRSYFERQSEAHHAGGDIIHTILPGVYKRANGVKSYFSRALVVAG